jgi:two-component sensor histidine kinase
MDSKVKSPRLVWLVAAIVILATLASGVVLWSMRSDAVDAARVDTHNLATVLASQADASIGSIEGVLRDLEERIGLLGADSSQQFTRILSTEAIHLLLRNYLARLPQADVVTIADREGSVVNFTRAWPAPKINLSDRDYFQHARDRADESLYVDGPAPDEVVGSRIVYFSVRISDRNGEFIGIILAGIGVDHLRTAFRSIEPIQDRSVMLLRSDGSVIVRLPESALPKEARIASVRPLDHYPLVVNVAVLKAAALAKWRDRAIVIGSGAIIAALCLGALLWKLWAQFRSLVRAEEHQELLNSELDHRVKNILARVAVITQYTRQGSRSIGDFARALDGRIQSMGDAHALLSQGRWRGVSLFRLVSQQLAPYTTKTNTAISGPDITLSAAATQAVAMVLQELVTNAVKYGSLSTPVGKVLVNWGRANGADGALVIAWRETDGPPVTAPRDASYGTKLIRGLITRELGGTVDLVFAPDGLRCDIQIPLKAQIES